MNIELVKVSFQPAEHAFLSEISLHIDEGSCVLVMGPSGSGKTLLLKLMAGIVQPTAGEIKADGRSLSTMSDRELTRTSLRHGFVFQDGALWQNMSLRQNLALPLQYHYPKRPMEEVNRRIETVVNQMGFRPHLDQRPAGLSGGNRTIASILRALMLDPELYFMDEPSNGLDGSSRERLLDLLKSLKSRGRTLVIASHDSSIASMLADRIIVLEDGRMRAYDSLQALKGTDDERVKTILKEVLDLSTTYDTDILEVLGGSDENPFG